MATWSSVTTSQLVGAVRLDAEFWQPSYVEKEGLIRSGRHVSLGRLVSLFKKGIFYILAREYASNGITFYRSKSNETWKHTSVRGKDFSIMSLYGRMRYLIHLRERWHGSAGRK